MISQEKRMPLTMDDPRLVFVPVETAIVPPPGLIEHLAKRWWVEHPERGIIFWRTKSGSYVSTHPQCNTNKAVTEMLRTKMYPWAQLRYLESVFRQIDIRNYV